MKEEKTEIKFLLNNFDCFVGKNIVCVGRIVAIRKMKNFVFVDISERGFLIQIKINTDDFNKGIIPGDLLEVFGICEYTDTKEKTILVNILEVLNNWKSRIPFKHLNGISYHPIKSFLPEKFRQIYLSNLVRTTIRKFFYQNDFFEVQTPILSGRYNGGRSFPVISSYLNEKIGFNRTTMEERMQALIGSGFEKIFQIGSIFRSGKENTFLEGYGTDLRLNDGKKIIKELLSFVLMALVEQGLDKNHIVTKEILQSNWEEIDFYMGASKYFNLDKSILNNFNEELINIVCKLKIIENKDISPESLADKIANSIFKQINNPVIINGFPVWSSPLYKKDVMDLNKLQRSRVYIPGQEGGFEIGIQENDLETFKNNIKRQNSIWDLSKDDERMKESDLEDIISGGLPEMLGFALSPDRILKICMEDPTIDSYK